MAKPVSQREDRMKRKEKKKEARAHAEPTISFSRKNYMVLAAGILSVIAGYIFLARGSMTLAPFLLVLGYLVIIPIGLILKK